MFSILVLGKAADAAYAPLARVEPFVPFRDASSGPSTFHLTVRHVLAGVHRARVAGLLDDWGSERSTVGRGGERGEGRGGEEDERPRTPPPRTHHPTPSPTP